MKQNNVRFLPGTATYLFSTFMFVDNIVAHFSLHKTASLIPKLSSPSLIPRSCERRKTFLPSYAVQE